MDGLRTIMRDFYERVLADSMIGFMFWATDIERLIEKEAEMAARMLKAPGIKYTGKPMREAHEKHKIMGGQFARRQKILEDTLEDHDVPEEIVQIWREHNQRLRPLITHDQGRDCGPRH